MKLSKMNWLLLRNIWVHRLAHIPKANRYLQQICHCLCYDSESLIKIFLANIRL